MNNSFLIKGNICHTTTPKKLDLHEGAFAVCVDGISKGVFDVLPPPCRFTTMKTG